MRLSQAGSDRTSRLIYAMDDVKHARHLHQPGTTAVLRIIRLFFMRLPHVVYCDLPEDYRAARRYAEIQRIEIRYQSDMIGTIGRGTMQIDPKHLMIIAEISDAGGFTEAAISLGDQPAGNLTRGEDARTAAWRADLPSCAQTASADIRRRGSRGSGAGNPHGGAARLR